MPQITDIRANRTRARRAWTEVAAFTRRSSQKSDPSAAPRMGVLPGVAGPGSQRRARRSGRLGFVVAEPAAVVVPQRDLAAQFHDLPQVVIADADRHTAIPKHGEGGHVSPDAARWPGCSAVHHFALRQPAAAGVSPRTYPLRASATYRPSRTERTFQLLGLPGESLR